MKVSLGPAKGKDSATTLGPWLVTADELEPVPGRRRLPGPGHAGLGQRRRDRPGPAVEHGLAVRGADRLRLPRHRVRAGDVLGSGTCGNGGCLAELWGRRGEPTRRRCSPATWSR